jgi:tubulin alpha
MAATVKTYVVTGTSSGIGLEIVKQLAARGDKVFATCRKKVGSASGVDAISAVAGDVTIIEDIDVTTDDCKAKLAEALKGATIDVVVHNAGGLNGTRDLEGMAGFADQTLDAVSSERMLAAFQLSTMGPLRVQQALTSQIASPGGKVCIISTGMGSIGDTSGGVYAYRTSKAAVNMVAKGMSCDLKDKGIAVVAVAPGIVATDFGPGRDAMASMGGMPTELAVQGLIKVFDDLTLETTGKFMNVKRDGPPIEFEGGW